MDKPSFGQEYIRLSRQGSANNEGGELGMMRVPSKMFKTGSRENSGFDSKLDFFNYD
jgi:hypothetical protein